MEQGSGNAGPKKTKACASGLTQLPPGLTGLALRAPHDSPSASPTSHALTAGCATRPGLHAS
eukprot:1334407-Alexandrium_andersonii.AAC.1